MPQPQLLTSLRHSPAAPVKDDPAPFIQIMRVPQYPRSASVKAAKLLSSFSLDQYAIAYRCFAAVSKTSTATIFMRLSDGRGILPVNEHSYRV